MQCQFLCFLLVSSPVLSHSCHPVIAVSHQPLSTTPVFSSGVAIPRACCEPPSSGRGESVAPCLGLRTLQSTYTPSSLSSSNQGHRAFGLKGVPQKLPPAMPLWSSPGCGLGYHLPVPVQGQSVDHNTSKTLFFTFSPDGHSPPGAMQGHTFPGGRRIVTV